MKMNLYCLNWKQYKYWQWIQVFHMFRYIFLEEHPFPLPLPPFANSLQFLPHWLRQLKLKQRQIGPLCVCVCLCWPIVNDKIVDVLASPSPCPLSLCLAANQICVTWTRLPPFPLLACPSSPLYGARLNPSLAFNYPRAECGLDHNKAARQRIKTELLRLLLLLLLLRWLHQGNKQSADLKKSNNNNEKEAQTILFWGRLKKTLFKCAPWLAHTRYRYTDTQTQLQA